MDGTAANKTKDKKNGVVEGKESKPRLKKRANTERK